MTALILLVFYASALYFLVHRLDQIQKYPKKFDAVPGYEEYRKSSWYWPTYHAYYYGTPPNNCVVPAIGITWILALAWYGLSQYLYLVLIIRNKGGESPFISYALHGIYLCFALAFCFFLGFYLTMYSKRPVAICNNLHVIFRKDTRSTAWEKMTKMAICFTLLMFFVRVLALYNYGYVDNGKIVYNPIFSLKEQVFDLNEIDNFDWVCDDDENKIKHCYIYNEGGQKFDLACKYDFIDGASIGFFDYAVEHLPAEQSAALQEYLIKIDPERFG